jgi:DNA mismatch repair protein MLH1
LLRDKNVTTPPTSRLDPKSEFHYPDLMSASSSGKIVRLDTSVVNRIAAGEIIQRPSNALKELLENSLDAGSTSIAVTARGGGLGTLSITDNGGGILKNDFALVCERFATSKLAAFEDLASVSTYGFRGEALASISHVARVTITSMTAGSACAYRGSFADGKMVGEPRACAGVKGTTISAEDMFYNVPARRAAFKNPGEEYARIIDVVQRYAIQHAGRGVSFSCKKQGDAAADVAVAAGASTLDAIANVFGSHVRKELVAVSAHLDADDASGAEGSAATASFAANGYASGPNLSLKKGVFILFINSRLVDCGALRTAIEATYSEVLPKGTHPFIYLDIKLPLQHVDVNVHPTKREVGFLFEDELVRGVVGAVKALLVGANAARAFSTQTQSILQISECQPPPPPSSASARPLLPADIVEQDAPVATPWGAGPMMVAYAREDGSASMPATSKAPAKAPQKVVRVDHRAHGSMDAFLVPRAAAASAAKATPASGDEEDEIVVFVEQPSVYSHSETCAHHSKSEGGGGEAEGRDEPGAFGTGGAASGAASGAAQSSSAVPDDVAATRSIAAAAAGPRKARRAAIPSVDLASVRLLLSGVVSDSSEELTLVVREAVLVGVVNRHLCLIARGTSLYLINHTQFARELFYQQVLRLFSASTPFRLHPPLDVRRAALLALNARCGAQLSAEARAARADAIVKLIASKAVMLREYFSIDFSPASAADVDGHAASGASGSSLKRARSSSSNPPDAAAGLELLALPRLVDGHCPRLEYLPDFILALSDNVDWSAEAACFHTVSATLAEFYAHPTPLPRRFARLGAEAADDTIEFETHRSSPDSVHALVAHVLLPAFKSGLLPPRKLALNSHAVKVASAEKLYTVFERC